jgi:putative acetyltransferase
LRRDRSEALPQQLRSNEDGEVRCPYPYALSLNQEKQDIGHITSQTPDWKQEWKMTQATAEMTAERNQPSEASEIAIRPLEIGQDSSAFRTLNEEWITRYFVLEPKDRETLGDPENTILRKGGRIFIAYGQGKALGCVALIPMENGVYELSKMAVSPESRGLGTGRKLLEYAIAQARELGAKSLFLGSNSVLKSAVHLYESVGFRHVPPEKLPDMHYSRANVFMEMPLQ